MLKRRLDFIQNVKKVFYRLSLWLIPVLIFRCGYASFWEGVSIHRSVRRFMTPSQKRLSCPPYSRYLPHSWTLCRGIPEVGAAMEHSRERTTARRTMGANSTVSAKCCKSIFPCVRAVGAPFPAFQKLGGKNSAGAAKWCPSPCFSDGKRQTNVISPCF